MYLLSVVFCAVRTVHKSRVKKRLTNDNQWIERHAVTSLVF
jgi:hypothetical protein